MSAEVPWNPPEGWWIMIRLFGSATRLPLAPPVRSSEPIDIAMPKQMV